jgi:hypothetical protein
MTQPLMVNSTVTQAEVSVTDRERELIEKFLKGPHFPWFWNGVQTINDQAVINNDIPKKLREYVEFYNGPFLSHTLLYRNEDENITHLNCEPNAIDPYFEFFLEIFNRFMTENNIKYSKIFRANLNLNWYNGPKHTTPHVDHEWPHSNFIMYLDSCEGGQTIIWPDDFSTSYMVPCIAYTAVTFKKHWHAHRYPAPGSRRIVFVVTYI